MIRTVSLPDETPVPALGQGTWRMGEDARLRQQEISAIRAGIEQGMTLIDTAEMYGDGATESLLGEALAGLRDQVFLVSKVYPQNAGRGRIERACDASLQRLKTDRLDLYLLHWRGGVPLAETVEGMEALIRAGKIARWGVSNLDPSDIEELFLAGGEACSTNQILYNITERGAEFDLLPQLKERRFRSWRTAQSARVVYPNPQVLGPSLNDTACPLSRSPWPGSCAIRWPSLSRKRAASNTSKTTDAPST
jgi:diketogulonate reductase-like aldo/keto reductase